MRIKHILPKQDAGKGLKESVLNELTHFSDMPNDPISYHGALTILSKGIRKNKEHFASEEDADEIKEVARIFFKQGMTAGRRALMMADTKETMLDWLEDKGFNVEAEIIQPYREEQAGHRANAVIDRIRWSSSPKAMDQAANNVEITAIATQGTSPHYKPGYQLQSNSFDQRKRSDIKAELAKLKQAMAQRFGSDAPIEYKITIGGKPVDIANLAENTASDGVVRFVVDTERAYQAVIKRFGNLIDYDENDYLVIPERLWPKVEQVAYDADGIGAERVDGIAEGPEEGSMPYPHGKPEAGDRITWYHSNNYPEIEGTVVGWKDGHLVVQSIDPSSRNIEKTVAKYRVPKNNILSVKKQGVAEGKIKLSTDPNWYGAEVGDYKASGPVVNIPTNRLVGFEPDDKMNQPASKANVGKIVAGLKQGAKLPPLMVRQYKNGYQVLDGHHRFWAYKLLGVKSIPAQVVPAEDIEEITKQGVAEGEVVKFPERHPWYHVTNCPECGGPLLGGTSEGRRVKACLACPKFYLEPNSLNKEKQTPKDVDESDVSGLMAASRLNKSFIVTARTAEGDTKKYRVKAQSERVAKEKFAQHHSMAKILNVQEEH